MSDPKDKTLAAEFLPAPAPLEAGSPRERTRRRLLALTKVAVVAALPLTATACDPAPMNRFDSADTCGSVWQLEGSATWVDQDGVQGLQVSIWVDSGSLGEDEPELIGGTGTLEAANNDFERAGFIVPDEGATELLVRLGIRCDGQLVRRNARVDLSGGWAEGQALTFTFE